MLRVAGLSIAYGSKTVVHEVDLELPSGAFTLGLLGPSGCGKSTLLRALAGLEPLGAGSVTFDGEDLSRRPVHRRGFGMVFQDGQLFPQRDVAGNIAYGLRGWSRGERARRVDELLELVGLQGYSGRRIDELSGGERQRIALARALAPRPRLLLLDEPLSALDRQLRDRLAVDIADIVHASKTPAIVVTHDHDEAIAMSDEIAVMIDGRIRQRGNAHELWHAPVSEEVARFVGFSLIVDGQVSDGRVHCALGAADTDAPDGSARVAAQHLVLARSGLPARVASAVPTASGVRLRLRTESGEVVVTTSEEPVNPQDVHLTATELVVIGE